MQLVDPCPHKTLTREILRLIKFPEKYLDNNEDRVPVLFRRIGVPLTGLIRLVCNWTSGTSCVVYGNPAAHCVAAVVELCPPTGATGTLFPDRDWAFDCSDGQHIMRWMSYRLSEYLYHKLWYAPCAEFPKPSTRSKHVTKVFKKLGAPSDSDTFDPREHGNGKPWIKLIRCGPRRGGSGNSSLRSKWLQYLYRGQLPADYLQRFPPLNTAVQSMLRHVDWDEDAALEVFGTFEDCDVELCGVRDSDPGTSMQGRGSQTETVVVRGINGLTVLFLSHAPWVIGRLSAGLLGNWRIGSVILEDLRNHFTSPPLWDIWPEKAQDPTELLSNALNLTFIIASKPRVPFTTERLCDRVSKLIQLWLSRQRTQVLLEKEPLPLVDILKHALEVAHIKKTTVPEYSTTFKFPGGGIAHMHMGSRQREYADAPPLSCMGLLYGCAMGTVASMVLNRIRRRQRITLRAKEGTHVAAELAANLTSAITTVLLAGGISITTDQTRDVFIRYLERRLAKANRGDISSMEDMFRQVKGSISTLFDTYESVMDRDLFYRRFSHAFIATLSDGKERDGYQDLLAWFQRNELTDDLMTLVPRRKIVFNEKFGDMFFYDLSLVDIVNFPPRHLHNLLMEVERQWEARMRRFEAQRKAYYRLSGFNKPPSWNAAERSAVQGTQPLLVAQPSRKLLTGPVAAPNRLRAAQYFDRLSRRPRHELATVALAILALLVALWLTVAPSPSNAGGFSSPPVLGAARVRQDFKASSSLHLLQDDIVFISDAPLDGWLRFEDTAGRSGVSSSSPR